MLMENQKIMTIVQVLGNLNYDDVEFAHNGETIKTVLSSIALSKVMVPDTSVKIIYYIPESVVAFLYENEEEIIQKLKPPHAFKDDYVKKKLNLDLKIPHEIKSIQSLGLYNINNKNTNFQINFENSLDNIIIQVVADLLDMKGDLIFDISTGFNIYAKALLEAARHLLVYNNLKAIISGDSQLKVQIAIVPPVMRNIKGPYPITLVEEKSKAFFSIPYSTTSIPSAFIKGGGRAYPPEIYKSAPRLLPSTKSKIIAPTLIAFKAITNNVPLALFTRELISFSEESMDCLVKQLEEIKRLPHFINGNLLISKDVINHEREHIQRLTLTRMNVKKKEVINCLFTLGLFESLKQFYDENVNTSEPSIENINKIFTDLYSRLDMGVNKRFLERDLRVIEIKSKSLQDYEEICLKDLNILQYQGISTKEEQLKPDLEESRTSSDIKRNFFAHSGFLNDFIFVKKGVDGNILIRYDESKLKTIEKWLKTPEK